MACQAKFVREMPDGRSLWKCEKCAYRFAAAPGRSQERCYLNRDEDIWAATEGEWVDWSSQGGNPLPLGDWLAWTLASMGITKRRYNRLRKRLFKKAGRCGCSRRQARLNRRGLRIARWLGWEA